MSTDKTLADVQPGGRVRLGDSLPPLPPEVDSVRCMICGEEDMAEACDYYYTADQMRDYARAALSERIGQDGTLTDAARAAIPFVAYAFSEGVTGAEEAGRAIEAALSAQPSPGGQDAHEMADALERIASGSLSDYEGVDADELHILRCAKLIRDLAARQPVGEPAYNSAGISLTACQLHEALLMAGDPELDVPFEDRSLVRIFWTETGHSGPGLYCECVGAEEEGCILLDGTAPAIGQSAQAVDLPYSLDADQAGIRARVCDVITGTLMVGAQGHTPPPVGHWAEPFWQAARADAKAQAVDLEQFRPLASYVIEQAAGTRGDMHMLACQLLALIDSQAVGK
ncbi:hypothetical protein [Stenotrophomonas maltophilia]|uniref:hypothetical protein n=1 Tax=Stenotrophomonas maltophilia TaxID=40324 RepID=UPI00123A227B|nr:hypothetical protein [Stenotrophomonas maltophilia]QEU34098.1 hypothetical protein FOB57_13570 [Stenotrophomonas maltophilia]